MTEGGQGRLYLVQTDANDELFVLKRLKNIKRLDRFKKEVRAGLELNHPYILKIIDYDYETDAPFIVTEYYPNGSLAELNLEKLSVEEKLTIFRKITQAVAFAHENNVIHGDIKPENIFLSENHDPVVGDFGLCLFTDSLRLTETNEAVGSRNYMAPELEDGKSERTEVSDVYSLGKLLYWLLTGKIFSREKHHHPKYDITVGCDDPEPFLIYELLDKMIVADPEFRFENANLILEELDLLNRRLKAGNNCIGSKLPQKCIFCGVGNYVQYVNFSLINDIGNSHDVIRFGFNVGGEAIGTDWKILVCDHCANVQIFRPDILARIEQHKKFPHIPLY